MSDEAKKGALVFLRAYRAAEDGRGVDDNELSYPGASEIVEALELLLETEWEDVAGSNIGPRCARCHEPKWNGHKLDCRWLLLMQKAGLR